MADHYGDAGENGLARRVWSLFDGTTDLGQSLSSAVTMLKLRGK